MKNSVTIRVPGSTSNCGSGFDTLGMALSVYGRTKVTERDDQEVVYVGSNKSFPVEAIEMVKKTRDALEAAYEDSVPGIDFDIISEVPIARGLGSSVVLRAGVLGGLNYLIGGVIPKEKLVEILTELEGHPDNAAAAIMGGFTVARFCPESKIYHGTQSFEVSSELQFVLISPSTEMKTSESRAALPDELEFGKVVSSINSLGYLVAAFASQNYDRLKSCRVDHLHEPYRLKNIPQGAEAIQAGIDAGALTGWLSGSGSTVMCVATPETSLSVKSAMENAFASEGIAFESRIAIADNAGMAVER